MIKLIIEAILIAFTVLMILNGWSTIQYNIMNKKKTDSYFWWSPAIMVGICWFIHFYFKY